MDNEEFTEKQLVENYDWVKSFDITQINQGYWCSICDPFLSLISELYCINIEHNYNGFLMKYTNQENLENKTIYVSSDKGHFWNSK